MNYLRLVFLLIIFSAFNALSLSAQNPLDQSYADFQKKKEEIFYHVPWISIGPVLNSARVEAIQIDPQHPGTFYVAFGSGNLWKSTDHGISWKPIFENMPSHGIGDIALAPSNSQVIYVGTGESLRKQRNFTLPGNGIYRSDDGGNTWNHRGLGENWHVGEIVVHPENPDIVFVAAMGKFWSQDHHQGIYKSTDGGKSWKRVLYVDENTRANDIVISQSNPEILYATMWENQIDSALAESVYGKNSGVYKSEDLGETWQRIMNGFPTGPKLGRMGVAVSYTNPLMAYVLLDNLNNDRAMAPEIYKTIDGGQSWKKTHQDNLFFSSTIGWYFSDIYVNPKNDEEIFALGVRIAHSVDGGKTFEFLGGEVHHINPSPAQTLHLDHCEMWINPQNPQQIAVGNDGGFYLSYDKGGHWNHYNNIPSGEFYTITLEDQPPYRIFGGTQDNATVFGLADSYSPKFPDNWQYLWIDAWSGGDGCITQLDPDDENIIYFSMQEGYVMRKDQGRGIAKGVKPTVSPDEKIELKYNFVSPYFISDHTDHAIYHAGNYLYKSLDKGDHWKRISSDLSRSKDPLKKSTAASALTESPLHMGSLYMGTDHGAFWYTNDDGSNWEERSEGLANGYIRSIRVSKFDEANIYLAMSGLNYDDLDPYLYRSSDNGQSWKLITKDLPKQPVNVILEDPKFPGLIYIGTHRGVFMSGNRGEDWELIGSDFPLVPVADLGITANDELIIATHGRGIYKLDLLPIYFCRMSQFAREDSAYLFPVMNFTAGKPRASHRDIDLKSVESQSFYFYLALPADVELMIKNEEGQKLWTQKLRGQRGINTYIWDQVLSINSELNPYVLQDKQFILPGNYSLEMITGLNQRSRIFTIVEAK